MIRIFNFMIRILPLVIIFLPGLILFIAIFISPEFFLAKTKRVNANILIVEGWLPQSTLELANKEFCNNNYDLIITTGIKSSDLEFCKVPMNGYLIFYPKFESTIDNENINHTIEVTAHSEKDGNYRAHFNFFVNDSLIADFNPDKKIKSYSISWKGCLKAIDSLMVNFDNDLVDKGGDRNLYIKNIILDHKIIIPYQFNSAYDIGLPDGKNRIMNNYYSHAEIARNYLISLGIDSAEVIAIPADKVTINRTLTSALEFKKWLKSTPRNVTGINIISQGVHSRRTWMTYKKIIGQSYNIGIISLPEDEIHNTKIHRMLVTIYEIVGLLYYSIILIPY